MVSLGHNKTPLFAGNTFAASFENTPKNLASQQSSLEVSFDFKDGNRFFSTPKKK